MAKPVEIGPHSFRTQKSALDHYKALLHRYQDGDRISEEFFFGEIRKILLGDNVVNVFSRMSRRVIGHFVFRNMLQLHQFFFRIHFHHFQLMCSRV